MKNLLLVLTYLFLSTSVVAIDLPQVDPESDTDNTINNFLLDEVRRGNTKIIAGAGWWGPEDKFNMNQLWAIAPSETRVVKQGVPIHARVACLTPGGGDGYGTVRNTLSIKNIQLVNRNEASSWNQYSKNPLRNGEFITLTARRFKNVQSGQPLTVLTQCFSRENEANVFGKGIPVAGDVLRTGLKIPGWLEHGKDVLDETPKGFNVIGSLVRSGTLKSMPIGAQAWYERTGYHYSVLDHAVDHRGRMIAAADLAGSTLSGEVMFHWYALRGAREENHDNSNFEIEIHHAEFRVEEDGEDHTYEKAYHHMHEGSLSDTNYKEVHTHLDTRLLSDGWHIISFHSHSLDKKTPGPARNMQLAAELKVPVCIENVNPNACEGHGEIGDPPLSPIVPVDPVDPEIPDHPTPPIQSGELIRNGGFDGMIEPWKLETQSRSTLVLANSAVGSRDVLAVVLDGSGKRATLRQKNIRLQSGKQYRLTLDIKGVNVELATLHMYDHGAAGPVIGLDGHGVPVTGNWRSHEVLFTSTRTTSHGWFGIRLANGRVGQLHVDNVALEMVDTPDTGEPIIDLPGLPERVVEGRQQKLRNGYFNNGRKHWQFFSDNGSSLAVNASGVAEVTLKTGGKNTQLYQHKLQLEAGETYELSMKVKPKGLNRMGVHVHKHSAGYENYGLRKSRVMLKENQWNHYTVTFVAKGFRGRTQDARLRLAFPTLDLPKGATVWFKHVSLKKQ